MAKIVDNVNTEHYPCAEKKSRFSYWFYSVYQYGLVLLLISEDENKISPVA
jgi:hypothetical protein